MTNKQPYLVTREEIWTQAIRIEAETEEEAITKAQAGEGEFLKFAFDHLGEFAAVPIHKEAQNG